MALAKRGRFATIGVVQDLSALLPLLRAPDSKVPLQFRGDRLICAGSDASFRVHENGIALFAESICSAEGRDQQAHYDWLAKLYMRNLGYPHTQEYMRYLDEVLLQVVGPGELGCVAEVCCGRGEIFRLVPGRFSMAVGLDVSLGMLQSGLAELDAPNVYFVQGDATMLPFADGVFDHVFTLGGIHHVLNLDAMFREIMRVLKPGGRFIFREPLNDFFVWRALRAVIYRLSPALDHQRERPLTRASTIPVLERSGLQPAGWRSCGFIGFCLLMNSDVLVFNRAFKYVPGIRTLTRLAARADDLLVRLPLLRNAGLQVVGVAVKA